jgi:hypothetical protein
MNLARESYGGEQYEIKRKREYAMREEGRGKNRNKDREGERYMKKRGKRRVSRFIPFLVMYS